jgi:hypothetical protein
MESIFLFFQHGEVLLSQYLPWGVKQDFVEEMAKFY